MATAQFWGGTHPLQSLQEQLHKNLVPTHDSAPTPHGELLRCLTKIYYDVYNNGFCNADALDAEIAHAQSNIEQLKKFMQNPQYWARQRSLRKVANTLGREKDSASILAEATAGLDDLVAAAVRYAAKQEGIQTEDSQA